MKLSHDLMVKVLLRLDAIDDELAKKAVPASRRFLEAAKDLALTMRAEFPHGYSLTGQSGEILVNYFINKYGDKAIIELGRFWVPYMYRGEVYFYRIPLLFNVRIEVHATLDFVQYLDMPENLKEALKNSTEDRAAFRSDMEAHLGTSRVFGQRSDFPGADDYHAAVDDLRASRLNQAAWASLQAAEKALKAFLDLNKVSEKERRRLGHDLKALLDKSKSFDASFGALDADASTCAEANVDFRYASSAAFTPLRAYEKVRAAWSIWAFCNDAVAKKTPSKPSPRRPGEIVPENFEINSATDFLLGRARDVSARDPDGR